MRYSATPSCGKLSISYARDAALTEHLAWFSAHTAQWHRHFRETRVGRDALPFCKVTLKGQRTAQGQYFKRIAEYPENPGTIGEFLRKRRLDLKLRQKDEARIIGYDEMSIVNWEKGHSQPRINHMAGVCRFLAANLLLKADTVSERILNFRRARGITQEDFANQLGIDPSTLARLERGEREPNGRVATKLYARLDKPT